MLSKKELLKTPEYWVEEIQNKIFSEVEKYMKANKLNRIKLAEEWGVSKGYITQILQGNCNFSLLKLVELSLKMDKAPLIDFLETDVIYEMDKLSNMVNEQFNKLTTIENPSGKFITLNNSFEKKVSMNSDFKTELFNVYAA